MNDPWYDLVDTRTSGHALHEDFGVVEIGIQNMAYT